VKRTSDYMIDYGRENDDRDNPDDHLRFDIARVADAAASRGGHPENAPKLEEMLLLAADFPPERNDDQPDLFAA